MIGLPYYRSHTILSKREVSRSIGNTEIRKETFGSAKYTDVSKLLLTGWKETISDKGKTLFLQNYTK